MKIALSYDEYLEEFAESIGGSTWKEWAADDPDAWRLKLIEIASDPANEIHFNLTGIDSPMSAVMRGASGVGRATERELAQVYQNSGWLERTTFWRGGEIVPSPF